MIQDRASWNAREPKETPVQTTVVELFLHHSVGSGVHDKDADGDLGDDYMRSMQNFHMDSRGWNDIAYNHAHDPDGSEFYEGRGFGIRPGAQCRHNTGTHSLVVMGDFRRRTVTPQLIEDIARFYHSAQVAGKLPRVTIQGHRDAPLTGDCTGTTCPGDNLYRALPAINQRVEELHQGDDMPTIDEIGDLIDRKLEIWERTDHTGYTYRHSNVVGRSVWHTGYGRGENTKYVGHFITGAYRYAVTAAREAAIDDFDLSDADIADIASTVAAGIQEDLGEDIAQAIGQKLVQ